MNEYSVLVYRVENGHRVDEFIYSRPFERVVNDYITSSNDIVDVKVKDRITILTYGSDMTRCIIDNSRITSKCSSPAANNIYNKKDDEKMMKIKEERKEVFINMMGSNDYSDVLSRDDMMKIYESVSSDYDTLEQLENDLDEHTRYNCLTFDPCLSSHIRVLLDGLTRKEVLEHVTGQYGYIELYYLKDDELYAMVTI